MNKNLILKNISLIFVISIIFFTACFFNLFEPLDGVLFNKIRGKLKEIPANEKILFINYDLDSIIGINKNPSDGKLLADTLLRIKGYRNKVTFINLDLSSPSRNYISENSDYLNKALSFSNNIFISNSISDESNFFKIQLKNSEINNNFTPIFNAFLYLEDPESFEYKKNYILLKKSEGAESGELSNLRIPLDSKGQFYPLSEIKSDDCAKVSIESFIEIEDIENKLFDSLKILFREESLRKSASEQYLQELQYLINEYENCLTKKEKLLNLALNKPLTNAQYINYYDCRYKFFADLQIFLNNYYRKGFNILLSKLNDLNQLYKEKNVELENIIKEKYIFIGDCAFKSIFNNASVFNSLISKKYLHIIDWYYIFVFNFLLLISLIFFYIKKTKLLKVILVNLLTILLFFIISFSLLKIFNIFICFTGPLLYLCTSLILSDFLLSHILQNDKKKILQILKLSFNDKDLKEIKRNPSLININEQSVFNTFLQVHINNCDVNFKIFNHLAKFISLQILKSQGKVEVMDMVDFLSSFSNTGKTLVLTNEEWAYRAIECALFIKANEDQFNKYINQKTKSSNKITLSCAIDSGLCVNGLYGCKNKGFERYAFKTYGKTKGGVNKIQTLNQVYHSSILCSKRTWDLIQNSSHKDEIIFRPLDYIKFEDALETQQIFEILNFSKKISTKEKEKIDIFNTALSKFYQKDFVNAGKLFLKVNEIANGDYVSLIFAERCKNNLQNGVPENWNGIMNFNQTI